VVACEKVVNCAGQWARQVGAMADVVVPLQPVKHQYIITEPIPGLGKDVATVRDPDRLTYFKEEVGGLVMGGYETNPIPWRVEAVPDDFQFQLFDDDVDHFEQHMAEAVARVPALEHAGVKQMMNGPESFTPDGNFILGKPLVCANMYVGCGFNAFGIASAGGAGWALAEWVQKDEAPLDLWTVDIRRFADIHGDRDWVLARTLEAYGKHYAPGFPHAEDQSARPCLTSPLYERLKASGAVFGSKLGWERPNWFAPEGMPAEDVYSMGRQNWFDQVGEEHRCVRERVGVFDQSSFAKFELIGPDALAVLDWLAANDVRKPVGRITYTQMLNAKGGIECDLTIARVAEDRFYIVTGTGFRSHDQGWILDNMRDGSHVELVDVTEAYGTLSLMGPRARDVLQAVVSADVDNQAFPFGHLCEVEIAGVPLRALRITYVGELGYELHVSVDGIVAVFDALMAAGAEHGIAPCGYRAIESLRLEKGFRAWGSDTTPNDTPFEAGLGWAVKMSEDIDFQGRDALASVTSEPPKKRFVGFTVDDAEVVLLGRETILRDGEVVGYLTSGGFGYTIGRPIGYGYVRHGDGVTDGFLESGRYELVVAAETVPAVLHRTPLYDPGNRRVKM
ncbi:MAG: GcvT family protein, partial [Geminicoccaceae bacterium]